MSFSDYVVTDDLTVLLGLVAATVFLLRNLYKPQPLVHPILLGRQSDVSRVRNPGESAIYRNYGTGLMGRLPTKPSKEIYVVTDLVKTETDAPRTLWGTKITNPQLAERIAAFGTGLLQVAKLVPRESNVLLLLNDSIEFLVADLSLAAHSIRSFTLSSSSLLSPVLDSHPPSAIITTIEFLPRIIDLIGSSAEHRRCTIIVTGGPVLKAASQAKNVNILMFSDIESAGVKGAKAITPAPSCDDVFTVSFFELDSGRMQATQFTHENLTAGVAAVRALLPLSSAISSLDTIVSAHSLSTAYGRAIAYTAISEGTNFATVDSTRIYQIHGPNASHDVADVLSVKKFPIPSPSLYFIKPAHLYSLTSAVLKHAQTSLLLHPLAWRHKVSGIRDGFITKDSLWDRLLFDTARAKVVGEGAGTIKGVVVSCAPLDKLFVEPARIAFSVPIINVHTHPLVSAPVFASHPYDLQDFPDTNDQFAHLASVGPPGINVEVKLSDIVDDVVEGGSDPVGNLLVRGPPVGKELKGVTGVAMNEDWTQTGERAMIYPNGSFKVLAISR